VSVVGWVLACVLIALLGLIYLLLQAREVWRKAKLLLGEVETASARAGEASQPSPPTTSPRET